MDEADDRADGRAQTSRQTDAKVSGGDGEHDRSADSVFNIQFTGLSNKPCSTPRSSSISCAGDWRGYKQQQQAQPVSRVPPSAGLKTTIKDSTKSARRSLALRRQGHLLVQEGSSRPATWWTPKGGPALWLAELWAATPSVLLHAKRTRLVVARPRFLGDLQCDTSANVSCLLISYTIFHSCLIMPWCCCTKAVMQEEGHKNWFCQKWCPSKMPVVVVQIGGCSLAAITRN